MKLKYIILSCIIAVSLSSCYKDLGNYDYKDINEVTVEGIEPRYAMDVYDSLKIYPKLIGTQYSDTAKFSYEWEIGRKIVATTHNLEFYLDMIPGNRSGRFIIKDRATNHKRYHRFDLNVSSATAGDLIMVLGKYQGRAELSYYRLDKPSDFVVNYYQERFDKPLGSHPQQLHIRYCESTQAMGFTNQYGRVMVMADDQIKLIDKMTLKPDTLFEVLNANSYLSLSNIPKPEITDYKSQFIAEEGIGIWRENAYGAGSQHNTSFYEISNGKIYYASQANVVWSPLYQYDQDSPYNDGPFSPFAFYDQMDPQPKNNLSQHGYDTGNLIVFDYVAGRFAYVQSGVAKEILEKRMEVMKDYHLVYGSATVMPDNTFFCILRKKDENRLMLIKRTKELGSERDKDNVYTVIAKSTCDTTILNSSTRYYMTQKSSYLFFTSGNKLYRYSLSELAPIGEQHVVAKLSDYGYDSNAKITSLFVSRTESTILLGVSRYGGDTEAMGEECKGDILSFSYDPNTLLVKHNPKFTFKGISGIPVDIKVKYQTHWRDGKNFKDMLVDNI